MKLLSDRILVQPIDRPKRTLTGLYLPDGVEVVVADGQFFLALSIGPECKHVSPGDTVFFHSYRTGAEELPDKTQIIRERNVLLVIPKSS